jgi:hypothetical protein
MLLVRIARDDELAARHDEVDADAMVPPMPLVAVRRLDHHVAARDAIGEPLELLGARSYVALDGVTWRDAADEEQPVSGGAREVPELEARRTP